MRASRWLVVLVVLVSAASATSPICRAPTNDDHPSLEEEGWDWLWKSMHVADQAAYGVDMLAFSSTLMDFNQIHSLVATGKCYSAAFHLLTDGYSAIQKAKGGSTPEQQARLRDFMARRAREIGKSAATSDDNIVGLDLSSLEWAQVRRIYFDAVKIRRAILIELATLVNEESEVAHRLHVQANLVLDLGTKSFDDLMNQPAVAKGLRSACSLPDLATIRATDNAFFCRMDAIEDALKTHRNTPHRSTLVSMAAKLKQKKLKLWNEIVKENMGKRSKLRMKSGKWFDSVTKFIKKHAEHVTLVNSLRGLVVNALHNEHSYYGLCEAFFYTQQLSVSLINAKARFSSCNALAEVLRSSLPVEG